MGSPCYLAILLLLISVTTGAAAIQSHGRERPGSLEHAKYGLFRYARALGNLKHKALCHDEAVIAEMAAAYAGILSSNFDNYTVDTYGMGKTSFQGREGLQNFMVFVAKTYSKMSSYHNFHNLIVSMSDDGREAYVTGIMSEVGRFFNYDGVDLPERSYSDVEAIVVFESGPRDSDPGDRDPEDQDSGLQELGTWKVKYFYEFGSIKEFPAGSPRDTIYRDWCTGEWVITPEPSFFGRVFSKIRSMSFFH